MQLAYRRVSVRSLAHQLLQTSSARARALGGSLLRISCMMLSSSSRADDGMLALKVQPGEGVLLLLFLVWGPSH